MTAPSVVLFDIDGTLLTTGGAGARAWAYAFDTLFGTPADITKFSEVGMTDPIVARQTFRGALGRDPDEAEFASLIMGYVMRLPDEVESSSGYRVFDGVVELLDTLASDGTLLGLVSGNVEGAAHIKIARGGLARYFAFGGYGTDSPDRGRLTQAAIDHASMLLGHPLDPSMVVVVGDTPRDVEAAKAVGAISVTVATGEYSIDQLEAAGADHALPSLTATFPTLR